jgi:hypothetical protein
VRDLNGGHVRLSEYIAGNLVGVSLTNVDEGMSGHVLAEMVDLVVSMWSLAVTGGVVRGTGGWAGPDRRLH